MCLICCVGRDIIYITENFKNNNKSNYNIENKQLEKIKNSDEKFKNNLRNKVINTDNIEHDIINDMNNENLFDNNIHTSDSDNDVIKEMDTIQ